MSQITASSFPPAKGQEVSHTVTAAIGKSQQSHQGQVRGTFSDMSHHTCLPAAYFRRDQQLDFCQPLFSGIQYMPLYIHTSPLLQGEAPRVTELMNFDEPAASGCLGVQWIMIMDRCFKCQTQCISRMPGSEGEYKTFPSLQCGSPPTSTDEIKPSHRRKQTVFTWQCS